MRRIRPLMGALWSVFALAAAPAHAVDPYPVSTLRIVVPFGAASASDAVARKLADILSRQMQISTVVENREGAGGAVAAQAVANMPANGSVILFAASPPFASVPLMQKKRPYEPTQFTPVARIMTSSLILIGSPKEPFKTFDQLREYARRNPGKLNYASSGQGSASHLFTEALKLATNLDITFVPYKSTGQQMTDVIGGQIQLNVPSLPGGYPHVKAGTVNALAVGSLKRNALLPDVPTFAEVSGQPNLEAVVWYGILGPRGMPPEVVKRLSSEIAKALESKEMLAQIETIGAEPSYQSPEVFSASIQRGVDDAVKLIDHLKIPLRD